MTDDEQGALRRSRALLAVFVVVAGVLAALLPLPSASTLELWDGVARDIASVVVTITAIWLGMLFGVAFERARGGSRAGGSDLIYQLMRPLRAGGIALIGVLALALISPYLAGLTLPGVWSDVLARGRMFLSLLLCVGALYGLLLALAPVAHILLLLRSREAEADAHPPQPTPTHDFAETGGREPWRS